MKDFKKVPKKYQPRGFEIIHEDLDLIVGNKAPGFLTVAALWNQSETIHSALTDYVRKGNPRSSKVAYVVHRLDQATSGVLVFAKSEQAQAFLKDNWSDTEKTYLAVVYGQLKEKSGLIESYLTENEDYVVSSNKEGQGKLARTQYQVLQETPKYSLVQINLLTGRKNQIRVHMADMGNPVVGDAKYGVSRGPDKTSKSKSSGPLVKQLALHSQTLTITHPHSKKRITFTAKPPALFHKLVPFAY
jgi:RluA family pseudouridine synthase